MKDTACSESAASFFFALVKGLLSALQLAYISIGARHETSGKGHFCAPGADLIGSFYIAPGGKRPGEPHLGECLEYSRKTKSQNSTSYHLTSKTKSAILNPTTKGGATMTAKELIIQLMTENDIRNRDLAPTLGISPSALTDRLKKKPKENMTLQTLSELLYGISILMEGHTTYTVKVVGSDGSEYVLDGYEPSHPIMSLSLRSRPVQGSLKRWTRRRP